jgi:hypothetical protein
MTKQDLQKELLEKVKPGMKPSDIKKERQKEAKIPLSPPPMSISRSDDGYETDRSDKSIPKAPPLPNQNLLNQVNSLQKQLEVYKSFKDADLKIKEDLKESISKLQTENTSLKKTIANLQNQANPTGEPQPKETKTQSTQTTPSHFYCDICQLTKQGTYLIRKIDSPFEPRTHQKLCYVCSSCRKHTKEFAETNLKEDNPYKLYD